jgi:hypothetical protein
VRRLGVLLVAYFLLGIAVLIGNGNLSGLPFAMASAVLLAIAIKRRGNPGTQHLPWLVVLSATVVVADTPEPRLLIPLAIAQGLIGVAAYVRPELGGRATLAASVGLYAVAGTLVITSAPVPHIDVFELQQLGARDFEAGHDPYASLFPNPYSKTDTRAFFGDDRAQLREYPYPPLSLLATGLSHRITGDVRWALLAAQLGIGVLLFALARGGGHGTAFATGLVSLHFLQLRAFFMLENAWTDSLIACAFLAVLLAIQRRRWPWLATALAIFLGFKQYCVIALPLLLRDGRVPRRTWIQGLVGAVVVALPFFVWGPGDFVNDVILFQLRQPFRTEAMSIPAFLFQHTGWQAPGAVAMVGAALAMAFAWKELGPPSPPSLLPAAAALVYSCFFLFAKQAFCNYYYFDGVLILGAIALLAPEEKEKAAAEGTASQETPAPSEPVKSSR